MVFTGIFLCVQLKPSARCREFLGKDRPKEIAHKVDPRIVPSKKESVLLKATRCDRFGVIYQNDRHNRCKVGNEVFGACSKQGAPLQRAEFVQRSGPSRGSGSFDRVQPCVYAGQCVAGSRDDPLAFLACSDVPVGCILSSRNCGYWNLAAEEIMFSTPLKAAFSSLIKVVPVSLCEIGDARRSQRRRVSNGTRGLRAARHLRRLDPHVPGRPNLPRSADELSRCSRTTLSQERPHSASWTRSGSDEMGGG